MLLLCTACSFQAGTGYGLDNGEKISVDFSDKSYAFKMAQDRDFLITIGDEKIADVRFYDAQKGMAFINKEPIFTENIEEVFDEGSKDGHPYISYSLYDQGKLKYYYLWVISETNCMLFETETSQQVLKDCFESITVNVQWLFYIWTFRTDSLCEAVSAKQLFAFLGLILKLSPP